jgi:tetratricopeptide (TPR) repeat protein
MDVAFIALSLRCRGLVLLESGMFDEARHDLEEAVQLYEALYGTSHAQTAATYEMIGGLYLETGDNQTAETYFRRVFQIQSQLPFIDPRQQSMTLINTGKALRAQGRWGEAIRTYQQAIPLAAPFPDRTCQCLYELVEAYVGNKDFYHARQYLRQVIPLLHEHNGSKSKWTQQAEELLKEITPSSFTAPLKTRSHHPKSSRRKGRRRHPR